MKGLYEEVYRVLHPETPGQAWLLGIVAFCILIGILNHKEGFWDTVKTLFVTILIVLVGYLIWAPLGIGFAVLLAIFILISIFRKG